MDELDNLEFQTKGESAPNEKTIKATIVKINWQKDNKIIAKATDGRKKDFSIIGTIHSPQVGQMYELSGSWSKNHRFGGFDFKFTSYRTIEPSESTGIILYLSKITRCFGEVTATRIVEALGDETIKTIKENPEKVTRLNIKGLNGDIVYAASETLKQNEKLELATIETTNLIGDIVGPKTVQAAVALWGSRAGDIIKHNPYRLIELRGIGFGKADQIHSRLKKSPGSLRRHAEALLHAMGEIHYGEGHTRVESWLACQEWGKLISKPDAKAITLCVRAKKMIDHGNKEWSLVNIAKAEETVADCLRSLLNVNLPPLEISQELQLEVSEGLEELQFQALNEAISRPVSILTGGPGTGKTHTIARIVKAWSACGYNPALVAPTGKAAKQMELAMASVGGGVASTIHSLLGGSIDDSGKFSFEYKAGNPIPYKAIIVDEMSMVDIQLASSLLQALAPGMRVLFVGDENQLPSVGPGSVLRDMLRIGLPATTLTKIRRNSGTVVKACVSIKAGQVPTPDEKLDLEAESPMNWRHFDREEFREAHELVADFVKRILPARGFDPVWQTQLICATNERGPMSCSSMNRLIKGVVNPAEIKNFSIPFTVGDKIVCTKNSRWPECTREECSWCKNDGSSSCACGGLGFNVAIKKKNDEGNEEASTLKIVNGDIGVIRGIGIDPETKKSCILCDFLWPDRSVIISGEYHNLLMAYGLTCHKMQGSGIEVVILPLDKYIFQLPMVTREWIYTAFSRVKTFLITIGDLKEMRTALARIGNIRRKTGLVQLWEMQDGSGKPDSLTLDVGKGRPSISSFSPDEL